MDEKISKLFLPILDRLYNTEPAGEPFRKPVDVVKYGCYDYYLYVKHPIDLSTIRDRLTNNEYKDAWRFIADIQLMFSNAYLFNKKGTPVYEFTNKLSKIWNSEVNSIMTRLNYCCGVLHKFGPQLLFCHGTTVDRYCQIAIGAKYKCYEDQYSFCLPCFNKIDSDEVTIQNLSCETARIKLPTQPLKKSEFADQTNDQWQYESFIQCTQCTRRVHQICSLYPADDDETESCIQHAQLEEEQKQLCQVPEEYRTTDESCTESSTVSTSISSDPTSISSLGSGSLTSASSDFDSKIKTNPNKVKPEQFNLSDRTNQTNFKPDNSINQNADSEVCETECNDAHGSIDDELMQFARCLEDSDMAGSGPSSPNHDENRSRPSYTRDSCQQKQIQRANNNSSLYNHNQQSNHSNSNVEARKSVDNIAARLSINKMSAEAQVADQLRKMNDGKSTLSRDKFVCNHCYRKRDIGFNLRHRKYSARRLPHTRMSRYIETKVNEYIRENSPSAGEVTIRVLTAYRDVIVVKPRMLNYVKRCKAKGFNQHPNVQEYPDEFAFTTRAIFAWQEIDGVDVCVFGMHVQEYGEDCPEPNKQVVYLSYLDSVHFFRPKQFRTAVYHEILLSYFKYVKKLGFRRVFIWVCPSRKGDDYIFYRHPSEQRMPTLKRLSDWYVNLLDKGIMAGIVEKHSNIYQFADSQNWQSILSMPYLSGDYWPGEFERLLNIMIESQKEHELKISQQNQMHQGRGDFSSVRLQHIEELDQETNSSVGLNDLLTDQRHDVMNTYYKRNQLHYDKAFDVKTSIAGSSRYRLIENNPTNYNFSTQGDYISITQNETNSHLDFNPDSSRSDSDQPLDLSKASSNASPESFCDDDMMSEISIQSNSNQRKRRKSSSVGDYSKKRKGAPHRARGNSRNNSQFSDWEPSRSSRQKSCTQTHRDSIASETLLDPETELMKNLGRSLKRQKEGFIMARLNDCDCSPHFEIQRRKEEAIFTCDLMRGREPFLQLARLKNYEFSTLRRAKFSSLAMVKHLGQYFKLDPICNECLSFDSSKRHYACSHCIDYYLCTSCHENTHHDHIMSLMAPTSVPDIDEFLQECSFASATNSISSASSTISNKSFNESHVDILLQANSKLVSRKSTSMTTPSTPLNRHISNSMYSSDTTMPLSCQRQKNRGPGNENPQNRVGDEENAKVCLFDNGTKFSLPNQSPPPSHASNNIRSINDAQFELDNVLVENFMRHAEISYDVDFALMQNESKKVLAHYWNCPIKDSCGRCKFVVLSCSFMNAVMRSSRLQMMINCNSSEIMPNNNSSASHLTSGINLTTAHRLSYQPKDT